MNTQEKVKTFINRNLTLNRLLIVIMSLVTLYLLMLTEGFWIYAFGKLQSILMPFIIGFGIAYILHPITKYFEKFGIKRQIVVPLTLIVFVALVVLLISSILPKLITDMITIINSSVDGIQQLLKYYTDFQQGKPEPWVTNLVNEGVKILEGLIKSVPTIPTFASQFVGQLINFLTTALFSLVIGLYLIFDYEDVTRKVLNCAYKVSPKVANSLIVVNRAVLQYLQTLIVIMTITFVEYTILYSLVGHNYALVLGVMAAVALLIPYIGPITVQVLAVLTSLMLPVPRIIALAIGLFILSNLDNYVISPFVYSKRDKIDPVSSLFVFFASSVMFGFIGILLSMPIYFSLRAIYALKKNNWELESKVEA